jgi:hypothetical protein
MARGWESKSVESQQDDARTTAASSGARSAEERTTIERRRALELSIARVRQERARATAEAHRSMLDRAIAALEQQLSVLGS